MLARSLARRRYDQQALAQQHVVYEGGGEAAGEFEGPAGHMDVVANPDEVRLTVPER